MRLGILARMLFRGIFTGGLLGSCGRMLVDIRALSLPTPKAIRQHFLSLGLCLLQSRSTYQARTHQLANASTFLPSRPAQSHHMATGSPTDHVRPQAMNLPTSSQTNYRAPFGPYLSHALILLLAALAIWAIFIATFTNNNDALAAVVFMIVVVGPTAAVVIMVVSPSAGIPRRHFDDIPGVGRTAVYAIRPFFARRKCEQTGGSYHSGFHGHIVDLEAPHVAYSFLGRVVRIRWEPALLVVGW